MTSSLVGSEMCIRDRVLRDLLAMLRASWLGPRFRGPRSLTRWTSSSWPVSYTHLTLPTICSV
eukprot:3322828-Prorocentrum_lima.AAC.1